MAHSEYDEIVRREVEKISEFYPRIVLEQVDSNTVDKLRISLDKR